VGVSKPIDRRLISLLPRSEEDARREQADESRPGDEIERTPPGSGAAVNASLTDADDLQAASCQQIVNASFVALLQSVLT